MTEPNAPPNPAADPPAGDQGNTPPAATRPEWMPESYWDPQANAPKLDEFGKHYGETAAKAAKFDERTAAVPPNPEGYKIELKLPDTVKVPEGLKFDPAKDPRTPQFLKIAHGIGLDTNQVNALVALDAELAIADHTAEQTRLAEETKKLGDKATDRIDGVKNWVKALTDKGDLSADEADEVRMIAATAAGVSALEKIIAKASGTVPGHQPQGGDSKPPPQSITERWYGGANSSQQKAS